jgi:hypothetical protein
VLHSINKIEAMRCSDMVLDRMITQLMEACVKPCARARTGFERCHDCTAALAATENEARRTPTALLWQGYSSHTFDSIAGALRDAGIPCYSRSAANPDSSYRSFLFRLGAVVDTAKQMNWLIYVLASDYEKAKPVLDSVVHRRK